MANTYNQIYVHFVFSVKNRENLINSSWENRLYQYIRTIINDRGNKLIIINGTANHVHMLVQLSNQESSSVLMRNVKQYSSKFIKEKGLCKNFAWQEGYGAFSYTKSHTDLVYKYIENQKEHHKKVSYVDEVKKILANLGFKECELHPSTGVLWVLYSHKHRHSIHRHRRASPFDTCTQASSGYAL